MGKRSVKVSKLRQVARAVLFILAIPGFFSILWLFGLISIDMLWIGLITSSIYHLIPFMFQYSEFAQREVLFLSYFSSEPKKILHSPKTVGLYATRNFHNTYYDWTEEKDIHLGVWHILPNYVANKFSNELGLSESEMKSTLPKKKRGIFEKTMDILEHQLKIEFTNVTTKNENQFYERMLNIPGAKIILYLHGSTGSRAKSHRLELYKLLREQNYHIIAFDYRGYGDSYPTSIRLSEAGMVHDAIAMYNYIVEITKNPIFLWGHSLGTGVSCHMLAALKQLDLFGPRGVILECPFNNIREELFVHPFAIPWRHLPWFNSTVIKGIQHFAQFESDKHIGQFPQPVLILHAEDDRIVPIKLAYDLYTKAVATRPLSWGPVQFHAFQAKRGLGHMYIDHAPELPVIINAFVDKYEKKIFANTINF